MKERPILMNGAMVRATLAGTKTQTRRKVKFGQLAGSYFEGGAAGVEFDGFRIPRDCGPAPARFSAEAMGGGAFVSEELLCPYGAPGDRLWVREALGYHDEQGHYYEATGMHIGPMLDYEMEPSPSIGIPARTIPSTDMPRWASRILLEIVSVRVERLQDISDADIEAEGVECSITEGRYNCAGKYIMPWRDKWRALWESTGGDWDANPWCWAITFKRVTP